MKKVIYYLIVPLIFVQCTDELHEIDSVISPSDPSIAHEEINLRNEDISQNSFTAFYYLVKNNQVVIEKTTEKSINNTFDQINAQGTDFSGYWDGYFDFEQGEHEFLFSSDKEITIVIDDEVVFNGNGNGKLQQFKIYQTLDGIRRLKVFYNMNSSQKLKMIVDYYNSLNQTESESKFNTPTNKSNNINQINPEKIDLSLDWRLLRGN